MANELRHESTACAGGTAMAKTDWEDVDIHRFESQAQGDIMYASSATQLSRLGAGTSGNPLITQGAAANPIWFTGLTFANDGTKTTILGLAGDYTRIGDAGTTGHSLASEDDLLVTGKLEVDGLVFFDNTVRFYVAPRLITDNLEVQWGAAPDFSITYGVWDTNAKAAYFALPHITEDANNVPVAVFGDYNIIGVDLGFFNGVTQPAIAVVDANRDSWFMFGFKDGTSDDEPAIRSNRNIKIQHDGDADDFLLITTLSNVPTLLGVGAYLRIGDAATTQASLAAEDDLMVSGKHEVYGATYLNTGAAGSVYIKEMAAALADIASFGQLWVKNTDPCELWFTDDTGTDTQIV